MTLNRNSSILAFCALPAHRNHNVSASKLNFYFCPGLYPLTISTYKLTTKVCSFLLVSLFTALIVFLKGKLFFSHDSSCIIVLGLPGSGALPTTTTEPAPLSRISSDLRQRSKAGFHIFTPTKCEPVGQGKMPSLWPCVQASGCSGKQQRRKFFGFHTVLA